jgi:hypothetical protein
MKNHKMIDFNDYRDCELVRFPWAYARHDPVGKRLGRIVRINVVRQIAVLKHPHVGRVRYRHFSRIFTRQTLTDLPIPPLTGPSTDRRNHDVAGMMCGDSVTSQK